MFQQIMVFFFEECQPTVVSMKHQVVSNTMALSHQWDGKKKHETLFHIV